MLFLYVLVIVIPLFQAEPSSNDTSDDEDKISAYYDEIDLASEVPEECVLLQGGSIAVICAFNAVDDPRVSAKVTSTGYERDLVAKMHGWLKEDPELGLIDIGSHIGVYALSAAALGHHVLAVEPLAETNQIFHKSVQINSFAERITLLQTAVFDTRTFSKLILDPKVKGYSTINLRTSTDATKGDGRKITGTILMDDLERFCKFKKAVLKIDIDGDASRAFVSARNLLENISIPYILMDWRGIAQILGSTAHEEISRVVDMTHLFTNLKYVPHDCKTDEKLNYRKWSTWPKDICWIQTSTVPPKTEL